MAYIHYTSCTQTHSYLTVTGLTCVCLALDKTNG